MSYETYHKIARYGFFILIVVLQIPLIRAILGTVTSKSYAVIGGWMGLAI
jgi:hypothetical protein